jgi:phosphohistidine phosphatase
MKKLILMRHAEAEVEMNNDFERALTLRGLRQAALAGQWLQDQGWRPSLMLSSAALRAEMTVLQVAEQLGYARSAIRYEEELYNASVRILMRFLQEIAPEEACVLLVAHNPGISYLAEVLTKAPLGGFAPGQMLLLDLDIAEWALLDESCAKVVATFGGVEEG